MKQRALGNTGLMISEIGMGCWAIGGNRHGNSYGTTDDTRSIAAIHKALELGCTFFDTADVYGHGHSEEILGRALKGKGDRAIVATKVGGDFYGPMPQLNFSEKYIRFACEESLKRLQRETIDLYQLHNPSLRMIQDGGLFEPLETLKQEGKIRFYGISIHDPLEGLAAMDSGNVAAIQVVYNLFRREAADQLFPEAQKRGIAIIAREPLFNGFLAGTHSADSAFESGDIRQPWPRAWKEQIVSAVELIRRDLSAKAEIVTPAQAALRFVLEHEAVSVTIPGAKTPEQIEENLKASGLSFSAKIEIG